MPGNRIIMLSSIALTALAVSTAATAQDAPGQGEQNNSGVQDIVVTAQKREQNLQDVPVSVSALTGEMLEANRITSVRDLNSVVPNLAVRTQAGGASLPIYTIRGLIAQGSAVGSDKGIAVYIDGVYMGAAAGSSFDLAEIERIEVLRGPQGTLFGRNSTGGAIQFITPDPKADFGVRQTVGIGNYDQFRTVTSIDTGAIGPFSASLTYTHSERRGDVRNLGGGARWDFTQANAGRNSVFKSPDWLGGFNNESVLAKLKVQASDTLDFLYRFDFAQSDYAAPGLGTLYAQPIIRAIIAAQPSGAVLGPVSRTRQAVNNSNSLPSTLKNWGHSLTTRWRVSDDVVVKNVTAYRKLKVSAPFAQFDSVGGLVNTGAPIFTAVLGPTVAASTVGAPLFVVPITGDTTDEQFSTELQINVDTNPLSLTAGGLYYEQQPQRGGWGEPTGLGTTRGGQFQVFPGHQVPFAGQPAANGGRDTAVKIRSYAFYASGEVHVTDSIDLVGGARYTHDRKTGTDFQTVSGANSNTFPIDYAKGKMTFDAGINFRPTDNILLYAKYGTGFISGGSLGGTCAAGVCSPIVYQPETARSWEGGIKADWFDRALRTNLAVFSVKYGNLQFPVSGRALGIDPALTQVLINAGDARAKGFELETTLVPAKGLTLSSGVGYTDFKFLSLTPIVTASAFETLIQYRPKWTLNLAAQYESEPLFDDVRLSVRFDGNFRSRQTGLSSVLRAFTAVPGATTPIDLAAERAAYKAAGEIPGYWLVNGRVALQGFELSKASATVALWGRNIFNYKGPAYVISNSLTIAADYERAPTYGVDVTVRF